MRRGLFVVGLALITALSAAVPATAQPLKLILPTRNDALLYGDGPSFYQHTNRYFKGRRSYPWEGGQYGFVRNAKETSAGIVYTRFHEGLDIKPIYRDRRDEPLDTVRVIDDGRVVYANFNERESSYGKYVVVEHWWSGSPFYSLYAHLGHVHVSKGQRLRQGDRLGIMGYTGRGIDRERAHLHFEINMLLSDAFEQWHNRYYRRGSNDHGVFNGMNLAGIDVAQLYLALQRNPTLTIRQFMAQQDVYFKVLIPNEHALDLQYRYPWLAGPDFNANAPTLEVSFTQAGLPVRVEHSYRSVREAIVSDVRYSTVSYGLATNHLDGRRGEADLSGYGGRYLNLLMLPTDNTRSGEVPIAAAEPVLPPVQKAELRPAAVQPVQRDVPPVVTVSVEENSQTTMLPSDAPTSGTNPGW